MAATRDLAKKLNPLWKYLYYWEAGGSLWTKSKTNWDLYSAVINLHDVQLMQQLHTHQFKCIQTADCGIWQQCVHSDVTQGCSDTRRRLRPPQLKTITAGISLPLFVLFFVLMVKKENVCMLDLSCHGLRACARPALCWSFTGTQTLLLAGAG